MGRPNTLFAIGPTDQRLHPLGDPRVDGHHHQRDVGDHTVCGHAGVPGQPQDDKVKYDHHDPGGELPEQGGEPQRELRPDVCRAHPCFDRVEAGRLFQRAGEHDQNTEHGGSACGQHRAENTHPAGEDEDVVQHNVGQTARRGRNHGQAWPAVVTYKAEQHVVEDKGRGKEEENL